MRLVVAVPLSVALPVYLLVATLMAAYVLLVATVWLAEQVCVGAALLGRLFWRALAT
jgi:hypothetical protein